MREFIIGITVTKLTSGKPPKVDNPPNFLNVKLNYNMTPRPVRFRAEWSVLFADDNSYFIS